MSQYGLRFRAGDIPVQIQPFFVLVVGLLALATGRTGVLIPTFMVLALGSVLLHEFGHAVAFRRFGRSPRIVLFGMGGYTAAEGRSLSPAQNLVVSLAGSVTQIVLLGIPALLVLRADVFERGTDARLVIFDLAWVSLGWGVLNLIPLLPLDGGLVMVALVDLVAPDRGERVGRVVSVVVAVAAGLLSLAIGSLFGVVLAAFFGAQNLQALTAMRDERSGHELAGAYRALIENDGATARREAESALARRKNPKVRALAAELLAWERLLAGDAAGSPEELRALPPAAVPTDFYRGCLELAFQREGAALPVLAGAFARSRPGIVATLAASVVSRSGATEALTTQLMVHDAQQDDGSSGGLHGLATFQSAAHAAGAYADAAHVGAQLYAVLDSGADRDQARADRGMVAFNIACSLARAGNHRESAAWLHRAIDEGVDDPALIAGDPDLESLRATDLFAEVEHHLAGRP